MTTEEIFALATVGDCRTIQLESHQNQRNGNLTLMQNTPEAPLRYAAYITYTTYLPAKAAEAMPTASCTKCLWQQAEVSP